MLGVEERIEKNFLNQVTGVIPRDLKDAWELARQGVGMAKILEGLSRGWTGPRHGQPHCGWAREEAEGRQGQGHPLEFRMQRVILRHS